MSNEEAAPKGGHPQALTLDLDRTGTVGHQMATIEAAFDQIGHRVRRAVESVDQAHRALLERPGPDTLADYSTALRNAHRSIDFWREVHGS